MPIIGTQRVTSHEPISLAGAKRHLRVDDTADNALIERYISAARSDTERRTSQRWMYATYTLSFPCFGAKLELYPFPLVQVDSITYVDTAGDTQTLAADQYDVFTDCMPGVICPAYGISWPSTQAVKNAVTVTFVAGYQSTFASTFAANTLTAAGGGRTWTDGDAVVLRKSTEESAALPDGWEEHTTYYIISATGSTFQLSATSGGAAVTIADDGTGIHYIGVELPDQALQAMLLGISTMHEHREGVVVGESVNVLTGHLAYESLITHLKSNPRTG